MKPKSLEERVAILEHEVAALKANGTGVRDWRSTIGVFTGDEIARQAFEVARKIREADRRRARKQAAGKRRADA